MNSPPFARPAACTAVALLLALGAGPRPAMGQEATQGLLVVEQAAQASVERGGASLPLVPGMALTEQDLVRVGPTGHASLRLARHGFADLGPGAEVGIERLPFSSFASDLKSVFSLSGGYLRVVWKHPQLSTSWPLYVYLSGQRMGLASGEYFFDARHGQQWACLAAGQVALTPLGIEGASRAGGAQTNGNPDILRPSACYLLPPGAAPRMVSVTPAAWAAVRRNQGLAGVVEGAGSQVAGGSAPPRVAAPQSAVTMPTDPRPGIVSPSGVGAPLIAYGPPVAVPAPVPMPPVVPVSATVVAPVPAPALVDMAAIPVPPVPVIIRPLPPTVVSVETPAPTSTLVMPAGGNLAPAAGPPVTADPGALPTLYVPPPPPVVAPPGTWVPLQPTSAVVVPATVEPTDSYFSLTDAEAARVAATGRDAETVPALAPVPVAAEPVAKPVAAPPLTLSPMPTAPAVRAPGAVEAVPGSLPGWSITYAETPDPDAARAVQAQLLAQGTPAVVVPPHAGGQSQYRVQQRGFASLRDARTALARSHYPGAWIDRG